MADRLPPGPAPPRTGPHSPSYLVPTTPAVLFFIMFFSVFHMFLVFVWLPRHQNTKFCPTSATQILAQVGSKGHFRTRTTSTSHLHHPPCTRTMSTWHRRFQDRDCRERGSTHHANHKLKLSQRTCRVWDDRRNPAAFGAVQMDLVARGVSPCTELFGPVDAAWFTAASAWRWERCPPTCGCESWTGRPSTFATSNATQALRSTTVTLLLSLRCRFSQLLSLIRLLVGNQGGIVSIVKTNADAMHVPAAGSTKGDISAGRVLLNLWDSWSD